MKKSQGYFFLAPPEGFEPPTPRSEDECSNPLSYGGIFPNYIIPQLMVKFIL